MKKPKNKVIDLSICSSCNYDCSYCIGVNYKGKGFEKIKKKNDFKQSKVLLLKALEKIRGNWIFNLGGPGEPFLTLDFLKLIKKIIRKGHKVEVVTNFSVSKKELLEFCRVTGKQLVRLNASLHLDYANLNNFFKKAILVNEEIGRQKFSVISVARKGRVSELEKIGQKFREKGIIFTMQLEKNPGEEQEYSDYNKDELDIIEKFRIHSKNKETRMFKGELCWAGCQYFIVDRDGEAWRCFPAKRKRDPNGYLGNLMKSTFKLEKVAKPCLYMYCSCVTPITYKLINGLEK